MKILFISQFAGSPDLGMVTRNYNWGTEFLKKGHDVTIIAASYSHYRNHHPDMNGQSCKEEIIDGLHYRWLKTPTYDGNSGIGRIRAIVCFLWRLQGTLKNMDMDYDLVIASSPHPFQIYQAKQFAKRCKAKLVYDIRDLWPLTLKKLAGMSPRHPFIMALQHAEDYACRHADLITAVPQNARHYLVSRGMKGNNFLAIGNGYTVKDSTKDTQLNPDHRKILQDLKKQNAFIIGYCGTLGRANAMHSAIEALAKTADKNIHLVLMGDGHQKPSLQTLAKNMNLDRRVHFLSPVPHNQIPDFLSMIDVAYIGALHSRLYKYGASPAKMNDYMACSKPILYTIGDPKNPIEQSGCGISCRAEDTVGIANAMTALSKSSKQNLIDMGKKGETWLFENQLCAVQTDRILQKLFPENQ